MGSLSLPQCIFPVQESNWGLLHYRQILYQLGYEKSVTDGSLKWAPPPWHNDLVSVLVTFNSSPSLALHIVEQFPFTLFSESPSIHSPHPLSFALNSAQFFVILTLNYDCLLLEGLPTLYQLRSSKKLNQDGIRFARCWLGWGEGNGRERDSIWRIKREGGRGRRWGEPLDPTVGLTPVRGRRKPGYEEPLTTMQSWESLSRPMSSLQANASIRGIPLRQKWGFSTLCAQALIGNSLGELWPQRKYQNYGGKSLLNKRTRSTGHKGKK